MRTPPSGTVGAVALVTALAAAALWAILLTGPLDLATGLLDARTHLEKAEKALQQPAFGKARLETAAAQAAVDRARRGLTNGGPLLELARLVPKADDALDEVPHLIDAADHSARAATRTVELARGALNGPDRILADDPEGEGSIIRIERVEALAGQVREIRSDLASAATALSSVDLAKLPQRAVRGVERGLAQAQEARRLLRDAEEGFALLPDILGRSGPRTYLIGMQNPAEQRGTGGAILQFALLRIEDGKPSLGDEDEAASTVYEIDQDREILDIPLPEEAWHVRGIPDAQRFGNSNWSPHWPLSARMMIGYGQASAERFPGVEFPEPDGFISVDPLTVEKLMPAVGPYRTRSAHRITADNVVNFVLYRAYARYPLRWHRRPVLRQVVDGFYKGLLNPRRPPRLVSGLSEALADKNMQVWMKARDEQRFVRKMGWSGALVPARQKAYMLVAEQNVGGNKLDLFAALEDRAEVTIRGSDAHINTQVKVANQIFLPQPKWVLGDSGPLHRPMISVYAPRDSRLEGWEVPEPCPPTTDHDEVCRRDAPTPAVWSDGPPAYEEAGKKLWTGTLEIPPGKEGSIGFEHVAPDVVRRRGGRKVFRLVVQQQPKVRPKRTIVRIHLPPRAHEVRAPGWERESPRVLVWDRQTRRDAELVVSWKQRRG